MRILAILVVFALGSSFSAAQDPPQESGSQELAAIRALLEQQSLQIQELTKQVQALQALIAPRAEKAQPSAHPEATPEGSVPTPAETATVEAAESSTTHVVAKGETLTSIAKKHKVNLGELLELNKITDDRKLQIGQTLTLPKATNTETPAEKQ